MVKESFTYAATPSVSARMLCRAETVRDIATTLGVGTRSTPRATWADHQFTCTYRYAHGHKMILWVKELPSLGATSEYMASLRHRLGDTQALLFDGQGGFLTRGGWTVTRKDNKVLVVDVAGLPATFGSPSTTRAEVAQTVSEIIFTCWKGD